MHNERNNFSFWIVLIVSLIVIFLIIWLFSGFKKSDENNLVDGEYYYVNFNLNGGSGEISPQQVLSGTTVAEPIDTPVREGYNFIGWYNDLDSDIPFDFNTLIYSNVYLYAKWISSNDANTITINFDTNGVGAVNSLIIKQGEDVDLPVIARAGYQFLGWYYGNQKIEKTNIINSDVTLTAHWNKIDNDTILYTIIFDSDGGSLVSSQSVESGKTADDPGTPSKSGYTFLGWYNGSIPFNFNTKITGNMTLVAKWQVNNQGSGNTPKTYTVTFETNGGSKVSSQVVEEGKTAKEPSNPTKTGYTFVEWQLNGIKFDFNTKITSNVVLVASWKSNNTQTPIQIYKVTFDSNGGTSVPSQDVESGKTAIRPSNPIKTGYTFVEWQLNGIKFNFNTIIVGDTKLIAKWKTNAATTYTVTFKDGSTVLSTQKVEEGKTVDKPSDPMKVGYKFDGWYNGSTRFNFSTPIKGDIILTAKWQVLTNVVLVDGVDLISNSTNDFDMKNNTINLQNIIDLISENGGGSITLPAGTYYFSQGGTSSRGSRYAIRCRNNVHIKGAGTNENQTKNLTVLKPYYNAASGSRGSMDMFYFNNYADTGYGNVNISTTRDMTFKNVTGDSEVLSNQTVYLINADFSNFVIDGESVHGGTYTTNGKGFMINLFKDCDWNNVVVKNTDATGFGMDCPINSTITNCKAIGCGKLAKSATNEGASGFGIGTGYSSSESITINNSIAINNKKFGFFFEHQARFTNNYPATSSNNYIVTNSKAGGNMYDFGGLKAFDVQYKNVESLSGSSSYYDSSLKSSISLNSNTYPVYFSMYSKNVSLNNAKFSNYISDITSSGVSGFTTEIKWAVNNGILPLDNSTKFSPSSSVNRFDAVNSLWKYKGMPGVISTKTTINEVSDAQTSVKSIGFTDLGDSIYKYSLDAIIWAYNQGIITKSSKFNPSFDCTRAQFITMLYRMAGSPSVSGTLPFSDVTSSNWYYDAVQWGYNKGIIKGSTNSSFSPNEAITKMQLAIFLYRYDNK